MPTPKAATPPKSAVQSKTKASTVGKCEVCSKLHLGRVHDVFMLSAEGSGCGSNGDSNARDDRQSGAAIPIHAEPGHATCDDRVPGACDHPDQGGEHGLDAEDDDFVIKNGRWIKAGVHQMISQAWEKHRRQQLAVSLDKNSLRYIFLAD